MELFIYGAGEKGSIALNLMRNEYGINHEIVGFIDKEKCGDCQGYPIYKIDKIQDFQGIIVIAMFDFDTAKSVCGMIKDRGCRNIFWFQDKREILRYGDFFTEQCSSCERWEGSILQQVEMHVIDSCNLNCRGCSHFSPIFPNTLPELASRLSDVRKLKEKLSYIMRFYILGGEPFLNPEINAYIRGIRDILPDTQLFIVTNGLLIEKLPEEVLRCIRDNQVWMSISEYAPTHNKIDSICRVLNKYKILYEIRRSSCKEMFCLPFSLSEHSKYPKTCISNICVTIWNGKIARCPQLMYVSYFNNYFNTRLPEEGVMELEYCPSGEKLLEVLREEVPLCKHCVQNEIKWSVCGKNPRLEDFAVYD